MVWIRIRSHVLSVLIWFETVCKGNQQTTKVAASMEQVKQTKLHELAHLILCKKISLDIFCPKNLSAAVSINILILNKISE